MSTRVYVPCTVQRLRAVRAAGGIGPAPFTAHAVTDAVRAALAEAGDEEWEHVAATAAAQSSVALLRLDEPACRMVLALDVPAVHADPDAEDPTEVQVTDEAPTAWVTAVLADSRDASRDVAAARAAVGEGSPDADRILELCLDHELGWWAAQEVDQLLEDVGTG